MSCTSTKNTSGTRWYHSFNTRYNVYFNGNEAFKEAFKTQNENYQEDYTEMILMYPVSSLPKDKQKEGGTFDKSIEKAVKAIKTHSIKTKPKKEAGKRNDPKYQEFMQREEYNPFLYNAWMLLAQSQFYNGDFLTAASTFSYISRLYVTQPEISAPAKIWQARCYSEVGWFYEAEDILIKINNQDLPKNASNLFSTVYADYLVKTKQYNEAIPYMNIAIKAEKYKRQKSRMKYLLGQIYATLGQNNLAYKTFGEVVKSNPPYKLEFSAKIRQTEVYSGGNINKNIKTLTKMAKSHKNKEYLDQVYYALGNIYMSIPDTAKAIESYSAGVEKSTQNGMDKALCQIKLADIYFSQREYIDAQPNYSGALGQLKKEHKDYPRVSKRSEVLDELVVFAEAVHLQDSLQTIAKMPESERMEVINNIIAELIKKEEEEKKQAEREEYLASMESLRDEMNPNKPLGTPQQALSSMSPEDRNSFYFYNTQTVATGKNTFQQTWGRRKLEDNWRRRNKVDPMVNDIFGEETNDQSNEELSNLAENIPEDENADTEKKETSTELSSDPKDPQFYLQQLPTTEEDIEASNLIIADGLFNMGVIFKDKLEDYPLAIENFNSLETRFPENEHRLDAYYHMYLMYLRMGDKQMADLFKSKIRSEFPESDLAIAMADPDYEYNIRMMDVVQDSIYEDTYKAYLDGNTYLIRKNYDYVSSKFTQSKLMPKFMFLNALSFVQTNEADTFKVRLKELIEKYPDADVTVLAGEMMKGFQRGLTLSGDGNLIKGGLFNLRFGISGDEIVIDSTIVFTAERNTPHLLMLIYPTGSINANMLLFRVAEFNFSNFMVNDFDLQFESFEDVSMLQIKGFNNYDEITQYSKMIYRPEGYASTMDPQVIVVPISTDNLDILMQGKSLDEYITFFGENYGEDNPELMEKWKLKQEEELEKLEKLLEEEKEESPLENDQETQRKEEEITPIDEEIIEEEMKGLLIPEKETIIEEKNDLVPEKDKPLILPENKLELNKEETTADSTAITGDEVMDSINKTAGDVNNSLNKAEETINEISEDPVRGIQKLFSRKKQTNAIDEYVKQQEKEEKERQKQLKKEQQEKEKAEKELKKQQEKEQKELLKKQQEEEKQLLKEKEKREQDLKKLREQEEKQKEDARKAEQKQKEEERKAREKQRDEERKEKEKQRNEERKLKEKQRKEEQKQKEINRKAEQKRKDEERKAREKQRDEERKAREKQRQEERKQRNATKK